MVRLPCVRPTALPRIWRRRLASLRIGLGLGVMLLAGCLGGGDMEAQPEAPAAGTAEFASWVMAQGLAPLRNTLQCLGTSAAMSGQRALASAQRAVAAPDLWTGGRSFVLDPDRLPGKVYVAAPVTAPETPRLRFALYATTGNRLDIVSPLALLGGVTIEPAPGGEVSARTEAEGYGLNLLGNGALTYGTAGDPRIVLLNRHLTANGRCTQGDDTLRVALAFQYKRDERRAQYDRQAVAVGDAHQVSFRGQTLQSLFPNDSDHYGAIDVVVPGHTVSIVFNGIRGFVGVDKVVIDGDEKLVTAGLCGNARCYLFGGAEMTDEATQAFQALVETMMAWTLNGTLDAVLTPVEIGLVAAGG